MTSPLPIARRFPWIYKQRGAFDQRGAGFVYSWTKALPPVAPCQFAPLPFQLTIHQNVLHTLGNLVRFGIGCGVKNGRGIEDSHIGVEAVL